MYRMSIERISFVHFVNLIKVASMHYNDVYLSLSYLGQILHESTGHKNWKGNFSDNSFPIGLLGHPYLYDKDDVGEWEIQLLNVHSRTFGLVVVKKLS